MASVPLLCVALWVTAAVDMGLREQVDKHFMMTEDGDTTSSSSIPGWTGPVATADNCAPHYFNMADNCGSSTADACSTCCDAADDCIGYTFNPPSQCVLKNGVFNTATTATQSEAWCTKDGCKACSTFDWGGDNACTTFDTYFSNGKHCTTNTANNFYMKQGASSSSSSSTSQGEGQGVNQQRKGDGSKAFASDYTGAHGKVDNHLDISAEIRQNCVSGKVKTGDVERTALESGATCYGNTETDCAKMYELKYREDHRPGRGVPGLSGDTVGAWDARHTLVGEVHLCEWLSELNQCEAGKVLTVCPEDQNVVEVSAPGQTAMANRDYRSKQTPSSSSSSSGSCADGQRSVNGKCFSNPLQHRHGDHRTAPYTDDQCLEDCTADGGRLATRDEIMEWFSALPSSEKCIHPSAECEGAELFVYREGITYPTDSTKAGYYMFADAGYESDLEGEEAISAACSYNNRRHLCVYGGSSSSGGTGTCDPAYTIGTNTACSDGYEHITVATECTEAASTMNWESFGVEDNGYYTNGCTQIGGVVRMNNHATGGGNSPMVCKCGSR